MLVTPCGCQAHGSAQGDRTLMVSARPCMCAMLQPKAENTSSDCFLSKAASSYMGLCSYPHTSRAVSFHRSPIYRQCNHASPPPAPPTITSPSTHTSV